MKITRMKMSPQAIAGGVNWGLLTVTAVALVGGLIAMQVGGFEFAPDAANLFLTKLPVLFLVALLIERTGEIFLTISRGGKSVNMEVKLETLTTLKQAKLTRDARLAELPGKITACNQAITGVAGKDAELKVQQDHKLKVQQDHKAALEKEETDLKSAKAKEDAEIDGLEKATLENGKTGTLDNRTHELADYKNQTRSTAMTFNFILALLIAACGFRAMEGLVILRPVDSAARTTTPALDAAQLEGLTQQLTTQIRSDRESLEKTDAGSREIIKRQQDDAWAGWLERELKDKVPVVKPGTPTPGATSTAPAIPAALRREIHAFRFFDILLTAGLLAGGADPLSRIMKLLRDFLDQSNKQVKDKDK